MKIETARQILAVDDLSDEQVSRAIASAEADAANWKEEAAAGELPEVPTMNLDWEIDEDLREAGVDGYSMQRLSFAIAGE